MQCYIFAAAADVVTLVAYNPLGTTVQRRPSKKTVFTERVLSRRNYVVDDMVVET